MDSLSKAIEARTAVLMDGAMGTELYNRGVFINHCFENANLTSPSLISAVHQDYLKAGAQVLTTNSWGANSFKLGPHNLGTKIREINLAACSIAKNVAGDNAWVLGSVGPLGIRVEPFGPTSFQEARTAFGQQIEALLEGGVDGIALETFSDISELYQALLAVRGLNPQIPVFAYCVVNESGLSPMGTPLDSMISQLNQWPVDVIGLNCSVGPGPMMTCLPAIRKITKKPLSLRPNAGLPRVVDGRQIYMSTPEYLAHYAMEFCQADVQFIGGCCGTSPKHIAAMANSIRYGRATALAEKTHHVESNDDQASHQTIEELPRVPLADKSDWSKALAEGRRVYSVELLPPAGINPERIIDSAKKLKSAGVHAINIPDGPRASARMSAMLTAVMIEQQAEIETVLHYTCRDRNLLGMQSDMLGIQGIGLRNMLLVTGDPPKMGSYPSATGVFDVDAIGLTNMVHRLNGGLDLGGRSIGKAASLSIGVGVNPVHRDLAYEMKRFAWKVDAGAEWAITQPVFELDSLWRFLDYIGKHNLKIPIVAGIWPLVSYRNAIFMNNEVPGVVIPEDTMKRLERYQDSKEDAKMVGVEIARDLVEKLGTSVQGIQVSAPFGQIDLALKVIML